MSACFFLLLLLCMTQAHADQAGILVVNGAKDGIYEPFIDAFGKPFLAASGKPPENGIETVRLDETEALDETLLQTSAGIIVTVGTAAARKVAGLRLKQPVLYTLIPESTYQSLIPDRNNCARQTAIYIDQPLERQAQLAGLVFPEARKYGVLLGPTSQRHLPWLDKISTAAGWELVVSEVPQDMDPGWTTRRLVEESDLMLAVSDPKALNRNNAKWLLYTAYQEKSPVIGFSSAYVRAGAAAAVYSTPGQFGRQAAEFVQRWLRKKPDCLPQPEYPAYFSVATNPAIIHSLGGVNKDDEELERLLAGQEGASQ
jgi:ABC-type uncharacterized transport system substrate-binding protein